MARYTTTHPATGVTVDVENVKRDGIVFATWAVLSGEWVQVGASKMSDLGRALKSAKSTAPYATEHAATPVIDSGRSACIGAKAPIDAEMADAYDRAQERAAQELLRRVQVARGKRCGA